jgi:hypothetical protein
MTLCFLLVADGPRKLKLGLPKGKKNQSSYFPITLAVVPSVSALA